MIHCGEYQWERCHLNAREHRGSRMKDAIVWPHELLGAVGGLWGRFAGLSPQVSRVTCVCDIDLVASGLN